MNQIPTLYELCCRAYGGDVQFPGYTEAFDEAMTADPKPSLILHRIVSQQPMVPIYRVMEADDDDDEVVVLRHIPNPFIWRVAYVNERTFVQGPRINPRFYDGRPGDHVMEHVVVIEEQWKGDDGVLLPAKTHRPILTVPTWAITNGYGGDGEEYRYPVMTYPNPNPRMLYPGEIMPELQRLFTPKYNLNSIKSTWFADAELSVTLVDGVPESNHHSWKRGRLMFYGRWWGQPIDGRDSWQLVQQWKDGLNDPRT